MRQHTEAETTISRRTVLAGLGSAAGLAAATGTAVGQAQSEGIVTRAAIPEADEEYDTANLAGYFVHIDPNPNPVQAPLSKECSYVDWPRDETVAYEVLLIDRTDPDYFSTKTRIYVSAERTVPRGGLFIINSVHQCAGSYTGIELEQLSADATVRADLGNVSGKSTGSTGDAASETTAADGPGFGVLAAVSGLAGAGALARLYEDE